MSTELVGLVLAAAPVEFDYREKDLITNSAYDLQTWVGKVYLYA